MDAYKICFEQGQGKVLEVDDRIRDAIWDYLGCLYKNGQILKNYELIESGTGFWAFVTLPDEDALNINNNNRYVNKYLEQVQEHFSVSFEKLGKNMNQSQACTCSDPSWYMLYTDWTCEESPVVCGDCGKAIPLYKLPHIQDHEHHAVVGWQQAYKNIDCLWVYGLSDRFTYRQMHNPKSQLAEIGLDICKSFEEKTGKPFFYYLFNNRRTSSNCPICGSDWKLSEETFIDYKCEKCHIVADEV